MWFACFCSRRRRRHRARRFSYNVGPVRPKGGSKMPLEITIDTTQEVDFTAVPVNDSEAEVPSEEPVSFTVQSGDVTLVSLSPTSVTIRSGAAGDSVVGVASADGSPTDTVTVHVTEAQATHFKESVSAPRTKQ